MQKPRTMQTWDEQNSYIMIQVKWTNSPFQVERLAESCTLVNQGQVLAKLRYQQESSQISSSLEGWLVWAYESNFAAQVGFQQIGYIYKTEEDAKQRAGQIQKENQIAEEVLQDTDENKPTLKDKELYFCDLVDRYAGEQISVQRWKIDIGDPVYPGQKIGTFECEDQQGDLVSEFEGVVTYKEQTKKLLDVSQPILKLTLKTTNCRHIKVEGGICLYCSQPVKIKIAQDDNNCFPDWQYDEFTARNLALEVIKDTISQKKLIMILDLDQTILHAIRIMRSFDQVKFVEERNSQLKEQIKSEKGLEEDFDLIKYVNCYENASKYIKEHLLCLKCDQESVFMIKLRPYFEQFFRKLYPLFDIYIYTKASRSYAVYILRFIELILEPYLGKNLFRDDHILTRDETQCLNSKSLNRLFPPGVADNIMIVLDDNEKMWAKFKNNYLPTKQYVFFNESPIKNVQGLNVEVESQARVFNSHDFWLLTITDSLEQIVKAYWDKVEQQDQQNQQGSKNNYLNIIKNISLMDTIIEFKTQLLKNEVLYFAISKNQSKAIIQYQEQARDIALRLGAKVVFDYDETLFVQYPSLIMVTNDIRPIKSLKQAEEKHIPVVHVMWILECDLYLRRLPVGPFLLSLSDLNDEPKRCQRIKDLLFDCQ